MNPKLEKFLREFYGDDRIDDLKLDLEEAVDPTQYLKDWVIASDDLWKQDAGFPERTLGDRLGELVVEFSEGEVKSAVVVLQQMEDTTDHAYNAAAIQLAFVLTEFSGRS